MRGGDMQLPGAEKQSWYSGITGMFSDAASEAEKKAKAAGDAVQKGVGSATAGVQSSTVGAVKA